MHSLPITGGEAVISCVFSRRYSKFDKSVFIPKIPCCHFKSKDIPSDFSIMATCAVGRGKTDLRYSGVSRSRSFAEAVKHSGPNSVQTHCLPRSAKNSSDPSESKVEDDPSTASPMEDLFDFICRGPLLKKLGSSPEDVAENIDLWLETGVRLCSLLGLNEFFLTEAQKGRIYHYYVPVYLWCLRQLLQHRAEFKDGEEVPPLLFGVSAPQGSGKTTLVYALEYLFNRAGRKAASISIDDFYLTASDQAKLAAKNVGNKLLELRGNAGTHDLELGSNTLQDLCTLTTQGTRAKIPRYDKSATNGRGDRADPPTWPEIEGPLEVAFLEGWMLGFKPMSAEAVKAIDPQLEVVNRNLSLYYESWERFIGSWIVIKVDNPEWVYKWRLQAEIAMKADGKPGMSDEEVFDFVARYMPAYKAYLPKLYSDGPSGSKPERTLIVEVDENRNPIC
eukprot:TRINITY_DN1470_c0_g1_i1.p1 TRINITY_DN1470_c0_g1~~TRINITY_DN1470_c0_g1_i1.p1  ORF type:complete len:448 (+),score=64.56 TRINITY_DN1470_c0_g1_i1:244-1587(+)